jgi:hypothetical protein
MVWNKKDVLLELGSKSDGLHKAGARSPGASVVPPYEFHLMHIPHS